MNIMSGSDQDDNDPHRGQDPRQEGFGYIAEEPDPEDFLPTPPKAPGILDSRPGPDDAFIPAIIVLLFTLVSIAAWKLDIDLTVSGNGIFIEREYWRLISAVFAHRDTLHLMSNIPLFLIFGTLLYSYFGIRLFLLSAVFLGCISNLLTIVTYRPDAHLLGASGMIYGLAALWQVLYFGFERNRKAGEKWLRCLGFTAIVLFPNTFEVTTSYEAHAFGFGLGVLEGLLVVWLSNRKGQKIELQDDASDDRNALH